MERSALTISLYVPDVAKAVSYYVDELGFRKMGAWAGDDGVPIWAEVAREGPNGAARVWFFSGKIESRPGPMLSGLIYVFVDDVDAEAARLSDRVNISWGPETQDYGLRELGVEDLNGYLICFARDVE